MIRNSDVSDNAETQQDTNDLPNEIGDDEIKDLPDEVGENESDDLPDEVTEDYAEDSKESSLSKKNQESTVENDEYEQTEEKNDASEAEKSGLTEEEKAKIKEVTGWSDEIIDAIGSWEEYEIYKEAGLHEEDINGRKCLIRSDIDWDQKDAEGRTNRERVNLKPPEGPLVPINKNGEKIELHHIGQHSDSPFAELTMKEHRGKGNYSILHDTEKEESEIDRQKFADERSQHWQDRANEGVD